MHSYLHTLNNCSQYIWNRLVSYLFVLLKLWTKMHSYLCKYSVISELSLMNEIIESLFIEIENKQQKNIVIGIIYRPPNANPNSFLAAIQDILHNARLQNKDSFIMGDFNINLLNRINSSSLSQEFLILFFLVPSCPSFLVQLD